MVGVKGKREEFCLANLENERRRGFKLQYSGRTQRFKHGIGVVAEGLVDHHQSVHVVHVEADLVRPCASLGETQLRVRHGRGEAHHDGVVVHRAVLTGGEEVRIELKFVSHDRNTDTNSSH